MSALIKRYEWTGQWTGAMTESEAGDWLKREDVLKLISEKFDEVREFMLWDAVAALKSIEREL